MAVVDRAEREVVAEFGVPGASVGVSGFEGGSGISINVGAAILFLAILDILLVYDCCGTLLMSIILPTIEAIMFKTLVLESCNLVR